jgi:hypothetical protein
MTITERFLAAAAQAGYAVEEADRPAFEAWVESKDTALVEGAIALLEKHFPRDSMEERMAEGPLLTFVKNSAPDIETDLDDGILSLYDQAGSWLKAQGNAGDSVAPAK